MVDVYSADISEIRKTVVPNGFWVHLDPTSTAERAKRMALGRTSLMWVISRRFATKESAGPDFQRQVVTLSDIQENRGGEVARGKCC